ncbi:DUF4190 domain-containing protein [Kitasatospora sp. NPDC059648]|uniref:DUF4190 domain-containing protein n=1 Tax=Kitasatospora sp. NPDC059648 TaxID=3346894 RepID=UPI00368FA177
MSKPESELPAAPGPDPRVDFRKEPDAGQPTAGDREPEAPTPAEPKAEGPEPAEPREPADPWAPPADRPAQASPASSQVPPQPPPPPLPAGGWASVSPSAESGSRPGHPYANPSPAPNANPDPHPPYVQHPQYLHPYNPQPEPRTNGFAVGSLATGLSLLSPVALVFGIVALVQINRRGQRGRGMAVTGLVLGVAGTLLLSLALGAGNFGPARDGRGGYAQKPAGSVRWSALKAGDCYNSSDPVGKTDENGDETVFWVRRVACSDPHHGEVAGTARIPDSSGPYPGATVVRERATTLCRTVLDDYALDQWAVPDGMDDVYLYPSAGNWAAGERYVTCAFEDRDDQHLGTVRTDRRTLTSVQLAYLDAVRGFGAVYADEPKKDVTVAEAEYRSWARRMAAASRAEAAALGKPTAEWPTDIRPKVDKLATTQTQAAAVWDAAASGADVSGDLRRARALIAKTVPVSVEIRRSLGLSTGEQVPDLRA